MTIRAIGFDLGETLIFYRDTPLSWASLYRKALERVASSCGVSPSDAQFSSAEQILANYNTRLVPRTREIPADEILSLVVCCWGCQHTSNLSQAIDSFFSFFQRQMCAYPDAIPTLQSLRERGIPTGILTDVPYGMPRAFVERDLDTANLTGLIDVLLTSVEIGVRKPETAGYLSLASRLGITPEQMLYIGNEPKDIQGACQAGMWAGYLDRDGDGVNHGQHFTLSSLADIQSILR
jgi:putative hydrolase of the HAD superfamily